MNRRGFIGTMGAAFTIASAGCAENLDSITGAVPDTGRNEFRESVEHRGVEVVPTHWMTADEVTYHVENGGSPARSAARGAVLILTRLEAKTVGENRRVLPSRMTATGPGNGHIRVYYNDERASSGGHDDVSEQVEVKGKRLTLYEADRRAEDAMSAVYPGVEIGGWIVSEIPEPFDVPKTTIRVEWGAGSVGGDEHLEEYEWVYTEDTQIMPAEAAELESSDGSTISI